MARVAEADLQRPHQVAAYRQARRALRAEGGVILADGVGMGKTYEALATVATYLAQQEHGKERKQAQAHSVLILVPPNLVTKWASELEENGFLKYLKPWNSKATRAVRKTFSEGVVVLRRLSDLKDTRGVRRYGSNQLPPGCYITNSNLLFREGKKVTQLRKTQWDAVIADEAHRLPMPLSETGLLKNKTKAILLTATPFQLSPGEVRGLLADTFATSGNAENARQKATACYDSEEFRAYRDCLKRYFRYHDEAGLTKAARLKKVVSEPLRERMIRNPKRDKRLYFLVDSEGAPHRIPGTLFEYGDRDLTAVLSGPGLIALPDCDTAVYLRVRNQVAEACAKGRKPFVAAAMRQLLSTYGQFQRSQFGRYARCRLPAEEHPKVRAMKSLSRDIIENQIKANRAQKRGWFEKVLIFTTFVGAEAESSPARGERRYGTAGTLKSALTSVIHAVLPVPGRKARRQLRHELRSVLDAGRHHLGDFEYDDLRRCLRVFAGSRCGAYLLAYKPNLTREKRHLRAQIRQLDYKVMSNDPEELRRAADRRMLRLEALLHRYSTRDVVARYDGSSSQSDRDRHLRGFNSPYAPWVLIASAVGQEGIDLQKFCSHVIHYDLEWNPAKLEQREGRVDRQGREADGPVKVYFLVCRETYDERVLHTMTNRMRWHRVLLPNRRFLAGDITSREPRLDEKWFRKVALDLRPRRR
jgi:superfamily II DNA or RNA helicase